MTKQVWQWKGLSNRQNGYVRTVAFYPPTLLFLSLRMLSRPVLLSLPSRPARQPQWTLRGRHNHSHRASQRHPRRPLHLLPLLFQNQSQRLPLLRHRPLGPCLHLPGSQRPSSTLTTWSMTSRRTTASRRTPASKTELERLLTRAVSEGPRGEARGAAAQLAGRTGAPLERVTGARHSRAGPPRLGGRATRRSGELRRGRCRRDAAAGDGRRGERRVVCYAGSARAGSWRSRIGGGSPGGSPDRTVEGLVSTLHTTTISQPARIQHGVTDGLLLTVRYGTWR
jgi:hypothetical protein